MSDSESTANKEEEDESVKYLGTGQKKETSGTNRTKGGLSHVRKKAKPRRKTSIEIVKAVSGSDVQHEEAAGEEQSLSQNSDQGSEIAGPSNSGLQHSSPLVSHEESEDYTDTNMKRLLLDLREKGAKAHRDVWCSTGPLI